MCPIASLKLIYSTIFHTIVHLNSQSPKSEFANGQSSNEWEKKLAVTYWTICFLHPHTWAPLWYKNTRMPQAQRFMGHRWDAQVQEEFNGEVCIFALFASLIWVNY